MSATWQIINCQAVSSVSGYTDLGKIVVSVNYQITATNGGVYSEWINIPTNDLANFIPYNQLTEQMLITWTKNILGSECVNKENLAMENGERFGLPWNQQ